jgi:hypothetical protein
MCLAAGRKIGFAESWENFKKNGLNCQNFYGATPSEMDPAVARATKASPPRIDSRRKGYVTDCEIFV